MGDQLYGDTGEMASFALRTRAIGEDITAQVQSSLSAVEGHSTSWQGAASRMFQVVEVNRKGDWGVHTQTIDGDADKITQVGNRYSDVDDRSTTAISDVI